MSAANPFPRTEVTHPITKHVDVLLAGDSYLRTCIEAATELGIDRTQFALNEAISFRVAEQEIHRNTWICCLCQGTYSLLGFQYHVCGYEAAVMTATMLMYTVPQQYMVADSVTTLQYLKTGTEMANNGWASLMWKLLTQHIVTLFLTCMNEVDLPMRQILEEDLLEDSIVSSPQTRANLEAHVRALERAAAEEYESDESE
ncbi:hypothetical protein DACRYDRAFT_25047 [Dacryopinax primogenitus]|uniref:Uncharacterized protein n=1 Tax=Dacryopinax primogenitus (strain DJM 731) TaxID=1858805 RepID=M5G1U0_DACPD|nr:uncharacterized protein DACRYDRAFT_25047 [Dacryopinax primogenitus]EJT97697.1 hypothetical protein DACRYDRAFT_25047 [Dacryopinax primogenitus]